MKKLMGLVVVLTALILGSYYGMGLVTERTLKKNIAMIDQSNGLVIEMEQYKRGWFCSQALLNGTLHVPSHSETNESGVVTTIAAQDYTMKIPLRIHHGPVMIIAGKPLLGLGYADADLTLPQPYADQFTQKFTAESTTPLLKFNIFVNYLNNSSISLDMPTFKLISNVGTMQFEWLGMASNIKISSSRNKVKGNVHVDGLNLLKEKLNAALGKVNTDYDMHRTDLGMYLGDGNVSLSSLIVTNDAQKTFEAQNLEVHSSSDIHQGLLESHLRATLDKLFIDTQHYGPVLLDISIKNIDAVVLAKINEQSEKLQQGTDAERQQMFIALLPELPKLLSQGAKLEVSELNVGMPEGVIKGNMLVSLPKGDASNPFQLIQAIEGQGKITLPAALLKRLLNDEARKTLQNQEALKATVAQPATVVSNGVVATPAPVVAAPIPATLPVDIEQQATALAEGKLAALISSGLFVSVGPDFLVELKLTHGQLSVNGKPFNPAMMQF